jgi:hypothetical protein
MSVSEQVIGNRAVCTCHVEPNHTNAMVRQCEQRLASDEPISRGMAGNREDYLHLRSDSFDRGQFGNLYRSRFPACLVLCYWSWLGQC